MNLKLRFFGCLLLSGIAAQAEATMATFFGDGPTGTGEVFGSEFNWEASPNLINPVAAGGEDFLSWGEAGNPNSRGLDFDIVLTFPEPWSVAAVTFGGLNNIVGGSDFSIQMFDISDTPIDLSQLDDVSRNGLASSGWTYDIGNHTWSYSVLLNSLNPHTATLAGPIAGVKRIIADIDDNFGFDNLLLDIVPPSADFDEDGEVDGVDFLAWQRSRGIASGASKAQGDADNNGTVDGEDLAYWESQYAEAPLLSATLLVPEPASCGIWLVAASYLLSIRVDRKARRFSFNSKIPSRKLEVRQSNPESLSYHGKKRLYRQEPATSYFRVRAPLVA